MILGMQNSTLGMASHDLSNMKTTILGAIRGAPQTDGNPHETFHVPHTFSERFFQELGWSPRTRRRHHMSLFTATPVGTWLVSHVPDCEETATSAYD